MNREQIIMKGTAAAEALQTSFKYNLAKRSRIWMALEMFNFGCLAAKVKKSKSKV
jgi:hypothetical protein